MKTYGQDTASFKLSKTYRIHNGHIEGNIDGLDAVRQSIYLILSTERYQYVIYSGDYGVELAGLIGKRKSYIEGDVERRITEALLEDDRIQDIKDFTITFDREEAKITFTAVTIFGETEIERSVAVG